MGFFLRQVKTILEFPPETIENSFRVFIEANKTILGFSVKHLKVIFGLSVKQIKSILGFLLKQIKTILGIPLKQIKRV